MTYLTWRGVRTRWETLATGRFRPRQPGCCLRVRAGAHAPVRGAEGAVRIHSAGPPYCVTTSACGMKYRGARQTDCTNGYAWSSPYCVTTTAMAWHEIQRVQPPRDRTMRGVFRGKSFHAVETHCRPLLPVRHVTYTHHVSHREGWVRLRTMRSRQVGVCGQACGQGGEEGRAADGRPDSARQGHIW